MLMFCFDKEHPFEKPQDYIKIKGFFSVSSVVVTVMVYGCKQGKICQGREPLLLDRLMELVKNKLRAHKAHIYVT